MSFAELPWSARKAVMGAEAESKFDSLHKNATPFGLNLPPIDVPALPLVLRYAPDRLQSNRFVECKGVGKDGILKLKLDQLFSLQWWDAILMVDVFIWDSYRKRYTTISLGELRRAAETHGSLGQFPEGKPIWQISVDFLPSEWVDDGTSDSD